jgi:hypothetical protein
MLLGPASAPLRRVSGAGEALGCASFVCGEGGSTEVALLLWKSIRPLGTHSLRAVLLPHLYCGGRAVILAEEWHTVDAVLHLDWLLRGEEVRDQVTILWNANNVFGFDHIDWGRLATSAVITTVSRYMKHLMHECSVAPLVIPNGLAAETFAPP